MLLYVVAEPVRPAPSASRLPSLCTVLRADRLLAAATLLSSSSRTEQRRMANYGGHQTQFNPRSSGHPAWPYGQHVPGPNDWAQSRANIRNPPAWAPDINHVYPFKQYLADAVAWCFATDLDEMRKGPQIELSLGGTARDFTVPCGRFPSLFLARRFGAAGLRARGGFGVGLLLMGSVPFVF